jgi:LemA protein
MPYIIAAVIALALLWAAVFNRLVVLRARVSEAWAGIDVQLKRRHDLVPNLVEVVKGYAAHERQTLEGATALRTGSRVEMENTLTGALTGLLALVERYPALKADAQFLDLQRELTEIEEQVQYARRYYNGTVRDYNVLATSFPSALVAGPFGFRPEEYFEIKLATERDAPEVTL